MAKKPNLFRKHLYIRVNGEECERFFKLIKGTTIEDEKFCKRKSTPGMMYVYRKANWPFRGEQYRDWKYVVHKIYADR